MSQARLDHEIAALTLALSRLRSQRNALAPVARLPPEILASVFVRCARAHRHPPHPTSRLPDWVHLSHVCRHWRNVALDCPPLWSFLFVSSQQWTDQLLARSKAAPLTVSVDSEYPKQSKELNLLKKVAPQAHRIQFLSLWLTRREAERILSLLSAPAPLLQSLRISVERSNYLGEPALVSPTLFDGLTPALRHLELVNYAFPLASATLGRLSHLRLRDIGTSFQPSLAELNVALARMPELEHLHLENALPSASGTSSLHSLHTPQNLAFPRLSRLSVIAPFSTVVLLLSWFDLPLQTEVRLRCSFEPDTVDYTPIYPLLAKRFVASHGPLPPVIRTSFVESISATVGFTFSLAERDSARRLFSASTTAYNLGDLHEDWNSNIPLKADIVLRTSLSRDREDLIAGVFRSMPLTDLRSAHLTFDVETALSPAFWRDTFGHLHQLRHMKLSEVGLQGLVRALSLVPHHFARDEPQNLVPGSGHVFAPALEEMELYSVKFSEACHGRLKGICSCSAAITCLYDALASRQAVGHGLHKLVFAQCMYVRDYDVEGLKESVTDVDWDGVTRTIPETDRFENEGSQGHYLRFE